MLFDLSELEGPVPREAGPLGDEDARRAISNDLGSTLFVEAGAGSGKTSAMVERIVELIRRSDVELREIAAVTFTEAAAAELRSRVRRRLARSAVLDGAGSPAAVAPSASGC
jgi:ATP-dependent helicase/nuclease subunit A